MSSKTQIYNEGTTVWYEGDEANKGGFGKIENVSTDYLGELVFEVKMNDGRVIPDVTPADFEAPRVAGQTGMPEFQMVDAGEAEVEDQVKGWEGLWGELDFYHSELTPMVEYMR